MKQLHGRYRAFFLPEHHAAIEAWYSTRSTSQQRHTFKRLVKAIENFDFDAAKSHLRMTYDSNIVQANAVFRKNGGHLFAPAAAEKAVRWLSFASVKEQNAFREAFGYVVPPKLFIDRTQTEEDFNPAKKFWGDDNLPKKPHKEVLCVKDLHAPSVPFTGECQVVQNGKTHYSTLFVWKVGAKRDVNVLQRAHSSTFAGAPWGVYGDDTTSNRDQWLSETKDVFSDKSTHFMSDEPRRFQNHNDNYSHKLYREERNARRAKSRTNPNTSPSNQGHSSALPAIARGVSSTE